jgi:hypothetical protein
VGQFVLYGVIIAITLVQTPVMYNVDLINRA